MSCNLLDIQDENFWNYCVLNNIILHTEAGVSKEDKEKWTNANNITRMSLHSVKQYQNGAQYVTGQFTIPLNIDDKMKN